MANFRLKELREQNKYSQEELSTRLGFARSSLSNWEIGRSQPDFDTLQTLANFFNVSVDYILGNSDIPNPQSITEDDFLVAFSGLSDDLNEEQKNQILNIANALALQNKLKK